jgi:hypothetical protein
MQNDSNIQEFHDGSWEALREKISSSSAFLSLVTKSCPDSMWSAQLGLAMALDKPIYLIVDKDVHVSHNLRRVAVHIERCDLDSDLSRQLAINNIADRIRKMESLV